MRRKRRPSLLEGIGGFGLSFASGIASQWNRMGKAERDKYDSVFDYVRGKEKGAAGEQKPAPVETSTGQSNVATASYTPTLSEMENSIKPNNFGQDAAAYGPDASLANNQSLIDSSTESTGVTSTPVDAAPKVEEQALPDTSYEEEMRRMQQQAQQEAKQYSSSFNDYSSGGSNGS
jgi:hypothetical protein